MTATTTPLTNHDPQATPAVTGTAATREFYDREGWAVRDDGRTVDMHLFGAHANGPIRQRLDVLHRQRAWAALSAVGSPMDLLEVGCGGNPAVEFFPLLKSYTATDFSQRGIEVSQQLLDRHPVKVENKLVQADACALPFQDASFDAVFSAHMIYHIDNATAQAQALREFVRVLRPGGVFVLLTTNPRPILWPARMAMRIAADTPVARTLLRKLKSDSPLPYAPQTLGWYRHLLAPLLKDLDIVGRGMPSTHFLQHTSETAGWGRHAWNLIDRIDHNHPHLAAILGNYVLLTGRKR